MTDVRDQLQNDLGSANTALGEKDKTFEWLDKLQTVQGSFVKLDPVIASLRSDPRYQKVLDKWKLN